MNNRFLLLFILCWIVSLPLSAAHITDRLLVGLYQEPDAGKKPEKLLTSGTPLEVKERRKGFARVRLADGTEGWVEATYVTNEKPAKASLLEAQAKIGVLKKELAQARKQLKKTAGGEDEKKLSVPSSRAVAIQKQLAAAENRIARKESAQAAPPESPASLDGYWGWLAPLITLALGFGLGILAIKLRIRRRFGGLRF